MLPNWLYGKSKSKLASILGGDGGIPEDYNQVKAQVTQNTEDILLISNELDDKAAITQISNPNILHNPIFSVNQRGFDTTSTDNVFIADRWKCNANGGTFTITRNADGTYTFDNTNNANDLIVQQKRTPLTAADLNGKKLTASIQFADGTIKSGTKTFTANANVTYLDETGVFNLAAWPAVNNTFFLLIVKPGQLLTVKALKLEVGEVSTLAMDPRPEYALELAKCQRYFQRISNTGSIGKFINMGLAQVSTYLRMGLPYAQKRVVPTITISGGVSAGTAGPYDTLISLTSSGSPTVGPEAAYFLFTATGLTEKQAYNVYLDADAYIDIDAEL